MDKTKERERPVFRGPSRADIQLRDSPKDGKNFDYFPAFISEMKKELVALIIEGKKEEAQKLAKRLDFQLGQIGISMSDLSLDIVRMLRYGTSRYNSIRTDTETTTSAILALKAYGADDNTVKNLLRRRIELICYKEEQFEEKRTCLGLEKTAFLDLLDILPGIMNADTPELKRIVKFYSENIKASVADMINMDPLLLLTPLEAKAIARFEYVKQVNIGSIELDMLYLIETTDFDFIKKLKEKDLPADLESWRRFRYAKEAELRRK